jgi:hypothetical protein
MLHSPSRVVAQSILLPLLKLEGMIFTSALEQSIGVDLSLSLRRTSHHIMTVAFYIT